MTFQATPHGVEVVVKYSQNTVPIVNVLHVDAGHAVTTGDLEAIAAIVSVWADDHMLAEQHPSLVLQSVTAKDISVEDGEEFTISGDGTQVGRITGAPAAANAAVVVSLRTARTGRSYRGRYYTGGLGQAGFADAQTVTTGYAAGISSNFQVLIDTLVDGGYKLCVLSRWLNKALRVVGVLTEIITIITDTKVDSQRRRTAN